jgi:hypothetical protein
MQYLQVGELWAIVLLYVATQATPNISLHARHHRADWRQIGRVGTSPFAEFGAPIVDEGDVRIDASREASLQTDSVPDSPPDSVSVMVSMFQSWMMAIKAARDVYWVKRRATAVQCISNAAYTTG